jgi:predicted dehydrogenase
MIGVLGLGSIGLRHARNALSLGAGVVAYDPSPERQDMLRGEGGIIAASAAEVLERADGVVIATPSEFHRRDLLVALEAGCHVLVEKPLAHGLDGLDAAMDEAERRGLTVYAALNLRVHPCVQWAKQELESGRLGTPLWARFHSCSYLPGWRPHQDYRTGYANDPRTGGVIFDFIHDFDLAAHLFGVPEVLSCSARRTGALELDSEDLADMVLAHPGGVHSTVHVDYVTSPRIRMAEIATTEGVVRADIDARRVLFQGRDGATRADVSFPGTYADDYVTEMRVFLDCVEGRGVPACSGREAVRVLDRVLRARHLAGLPS